MNRLFPLLLSLLLVVPMQFMAQSTHFDLTANMLVNYGVWKKGEQVNIRWFVHETEIDPYSDGVRELFYLEDSEGQRMEIKSKVGYCFDFQCNDIQQLWDASIVTNVLHSLTKNGFRYDLRREMEDDALRYIQEVKDRGLEFNDPYLETYIYSLIAKIAPVYMLDGRPGSVNLLIQQNPTINACCYPNGTIVLNTGLLAALHSEAELVAILSHEIAHFVLDHSIQNVIAEEQRQKRAEFWAGLLTGLTAIAEGVVASQNSYYVPGAATVGMAVLSTSIAASINKRLGMEYNHAQESEADHLAIEVLRMLGYDSNALATALKRLEGEYIRERNNAMYIAAYTHPSLMSRIDGAGTPQVVKEKTFEQIISFAVSNVAMMKYNDRRFRQCLPYVCQNIENNVATSDDYLLKANCLLSTKDDEESNLEALSLINKAKSIDEKNINLYKIEIIASLRLDDKPRAIELLNAYINTLNGMDFSDIRSANYWEDLIEFVNTEKRWANQMIVKLSGM